MKTLLMFLSLVLLQLTLSSRAEESLESPYNSTFPRAVVYKTTPTLKFSLVPTVPLPVRRAVIVPIARVYVTPLLTWKPKFFGFEGEKLNSWERLSLSSFAPTKSFMPGLYYVHRDPYADSDEGSDIFGRKWRLSSRTELVLPLCKWDYPSAVEERLAACVLFTTKF